MAGCFTLESIIVKISSNFVLNLNYQFELKNAHSLQNVFCLIDIKKPTVIIQKSKKKCHFLKFI